MNRRAHPLAILAVVLYTLVSLTPILWMLLTSFKHPSDVPATPPGLVPSFSDADPAPYHFRFTLQNYVDQLHNTDVAAALLNSVIIAGVTTIASVFLGAFAAYGFSRFRMAGSKDAQFFILSTRMLPAMAVSVPITWMYARLGLMDTRCGLILLYTCFNLSFSTWMMKAFIDEIPTAYEEAALLDGYSRLQVLCKIILPQAGAGIMATAVFCLISAWNEYAFAVALTETNAVTLPIYIAGKFSRPGPVVGTLSAGAILFMLPVVIFTLLMRKHLLRGVTFGAVKG